MNRIEHPLLKTGAAALVLGLFTFMGVSAVSLVHQTTEQRILQNQREASRQAFERVLEAGLYDNHPIDHPVRVESAEWVNGGQPIIIYNATLKGRPVATLLSINAPSGYNGNIILLIGILSDGTLSGVEVVKHRETPGLGDKIESHRSGWLKQFHGRSINSPEPDGWRVARDGGVFDQVSGATVTSRAVVESLKQVLTYLQTQRPDMFLLSGSVVLDKATEDVIPMMDSTDGWEQLEGSPTPSSTTRLI